MRLLKTPLVAALALLAGVSSVLAQTRELWLVEELRLGAADGLGPEMFGDVDDLAIDEQGRIFLLDTGMREVRLFDSDGAFVRRIAPEGEGPDERRHRRDDFFAPARVTWDGARAGLWLDDSTQLQAFDSLGTERRRGSVWRSFYSDQAPASKLVAVDDRQRVYEHQRMFVGDSMFTYIARGVANPDFETTYSDTLVVDARIIEAGEPQTTRRTISNANVTGVMIPLRPERDERAWTVSPHGAVWVASTDGSQLSQLSFEGDTLRAIAVEAAPSELDVSAEGWIWSRRATDDAPSTWDLFDDCGEPRGSVSVRDRVLFTEVGAGGVVHVVTADELDLEYVLRLRLTGTRIERACQQ